MSSNVATADLSAAINLCEEVIEERRRQIQKWGDQHRRNHSQTPTGVTWRSQYAYKAEDYQRRNDIGTLVGWDSILLEEVYEALAEGEPALIREELLQVAAVALAWIEDMDNQEVQKS